MAGDTYEEFRRAVERPEEALDLGRAALAIACGDYPTLDIAAYLSRIDQLAVEVLTYQGGDGSGLYRNIAALNYVLFQNHRFQGNRDAYFDPKNSFLNQVIERRRGIPITLSVLYMEVAQRIGLTLQGVGFPGHFLVKYSDHRKEIVLDPFNGGEIKSIDSLQQLLDGLYGGKLAFHPQLLEPVTKKQILRRMLSNLKYIYLRESDLLKALSVLDRLTILEPNTAEDLRERGYVYLKLECFQRAQMDFEAYLRVAPHADDLSTIREQMLDLGKHLRQIH
jgi:regulator of sirC expression with transglutaminase-like and TPR domain